MRVIICGAGQVGTAIAKRLVSENNSVVLIDQSAELIQQLGDKLDVQAHVGWASHPGVLSAAGAANADMLIAVTHADEINMVACQIAHSLFDVPVRIARIRHQSYLEKEWFELYRQDHMPIDYIISPEIEVAKAIAYHFHVPGASDTVPFADKRLKIISIRCDKNCPLEKTPLLQIIQKLEPLQTSVAGILREGVFFIPNEDEYFLLGDELYIMVNSHYILHVMSLFGYDNKEARRVIISGGGNIGFFLAKLLKQESEGLRIKIIELDKKRAEFIVDELGGEITVLQGSSLSKEILDEANIANTEAFIAVTNDDKVNILSSLLAKRFGSSRAFSLIKDNTSYAPLMASLGIDAVVSPKEITISSILQFIKKGDICNTYSLCGGLAELIELDIREDSPAIGCEVSALGLPQGAKIGAILRPDAVVILQDNSDIIIRKHDHLLIMCQAGLVNKVEEIIAPKDNFY